MDIPSSQPPAQVTIRPASATDDFSAVVALQETVWGAISAIVPAPQLIAVAHAGGTVLLARDEHRSPVGFCYGFVGLDSADQGDGGFTEPILWSHMLAVLPGWRRRGLGTRLKLAQADVARRQGLTRIQWTFDPLEAANAHLNLSRLGAIAARYSVNRYGPMDDVLNAGLETDRLIADWWVAGEPRPAHPGPRRPADPPLVLNPDPPDGPVLGPADLIRHEGSIRITVPAGPWRSDRERARAWRQNVRAAFARAFDAGYVAVGIDLHPPLASYRLERA